MMIEYKEITQIKSCIRQIKHIYQSAGWIAYLRNDEKLLRAFENSLFTLGAFDGETLVGFARCVGDGEHILLVQDLIVDSNYQKQRIGTLLFEMVWEKYRDVRMFHIITDKNDIAANRFYQSFEMKQLVDGDMVSYFR